MDWLKILMVGLRNELMISSVFCGMKQIFFISLLTAICTVPLFSQATDNQTVKRDSTSLSKDSTLAVSIEKTVKNDSFPVPKKAILWALVPGGGQIYNRKKAWIKAPIVWAAFGTCGYLIVDNTKFYRKYKTAYARKVNNLPIDDEDISENIPAERLKQARDSRYKWLQQSYIAVGVTYLVSGVWAFADAHLAHFDVNDDLSMKIKPSFESVPAYGNAFGVGLSVKF